MKQYHGKLYDDNPNLQDTKQTTTNLITSLEDIPGYFQNGKDYTAFFRGYFKAPADGKYQF